LVRASGIFIAYLLLACPALTFFSCATAPPAQSAPSLRTPSSGLSRGTFQRRIRVERDSELARFAASKRWRLPWWSETYLRSGATVEVAGEAYVVSEFIGYGSQGCVYEVEGPGGRRTLKVFNLNERSRIAEEALLLRDMREAGLPVVEIERIDVERGAVVMAYHEGIDLARVLEAPEEFDLAPAQVLALKAKFEALAEQVARFRRSRKLPTRVTEKHNVILDVETGELLLIDPI
jgi:tRNA A-37 threonylcarbamoyl transferase component Bud32